MGYSLSVITLNTCAGLCAEEGFPFVGLQGMQQCFCGSSYGRHGNARCKYTRRSILLNSGANVQPLPHSHIYSLAFIISAHEHFLKMFSSDSLRFVKKLSKKWCMYIGLFPYIYTNLYEHALNYLTWISMPITRSTWITSRMYVYVQLQH